jgi:predicted acetyltransferase
MNVAIERAADNDLLLFQRLMQLYLYDFSEFIPLYLDEQGLFEQTILDDYFRNPTKTPFLIKANAQIGGFVLVNSEPLLAINSGGMRLKEFFVLRGFRKQGIGRRAAQAVFDVFPGRWELGVVALNIAAQAFWQSTIESYTAGNYHKVVRADNQWNGPIFSFDTSYKDEQRNS